MTLDSSGNVGIGVTPESWHSSYTALQVGGTGSIFAHNTQAAGSDLHINQNAYYDDAWRYIVTDEATNVATNDGQFRFRVAASGTADAAITWTTAMTIANGGDVTVGTGNLVIGTAGKGIDFSAQTATSASGAATTGELLDHYEEGTWTPAYSTTGGSFTYDAATAGNYTKVGNIVHVHFRIYTTSATVGTGNVYITGLPFTTAAVQTTGSIGDCRLWGGDTPDTLVFWGAASLAPYYRTVVNGANSIIDASDLSAVAGAKNLIDGQVTYTAV